MSQCEEPPVSVSVSIRTVAACSTLSVWIESNLLTSQTVADVSTSWQADDDDDSAARKKESSFVGFVISVFQQHVSFVLQPRFRIAAFSVLISITDYRTTRDKSKMQRQDAPLKVNGRHYLE